MGTKEQHTRELLRRWISGEINAREEAELLAAAEHDQFLREALAAYRALPEVDHAAALSRLRRAPVAAAGPAKARSLTRWAAVAASVLVLLTAAWWLLDSPLDQATSSMALEEETAPATTDDAEVDITAPPVLEAEPDSEPAPIAQAAPRPSLAPEPPPALRLPQRDSDPTASGSTEKIVAEPAESLSMTADFTIADSTPVPGTYARPLDKEVVALESETAADEVVPTTSAPPTPYTVPAQEDLARKRSYTNNSGVPVPAAGFRILEGYVRDAEGYPLIGATVREQGTANGTVTDIDGYFRLSVAENSEQLVVSYTGYETSEILLEMSDSDLDIAMTESNSQLDEVVVTGSGYGQRQTDDQEGLAEIARPVGGFRALKKYIEENTPVNTPRARVKLRFQVQSDGRLTDMTVIRSTNIGQNELAIDLLTAGPRWEISSGNAPVAVEYVVKFR